MYVHKICTYTFKGIIFILFILSIFNVSIYHKFIYLYGELRVVQNSKDKGAV